MIKGALWFSIILLISAEEWFVSSRSAPHRQRRQLQSPNTIYLRPLRNGQFLRQIPIHFLPPFRDRPSSSSSSGSSMLQSPWVPLRTRTENSQSNAYRLPKRPPSDIVTRKPQKNTWDIPLSKSIQVDQARPNIQTTGYIRKNVVNVYETRTTTENPGIRSLGSLAESTVHTLLNFTPVDEGWRPKSPTTNRPRQSSVPRYGTKLGAHVDKHLNYTGIRYGKVNSVVRSRPKSGNTVKVVKNETNFLMRFTPEDIKYTAVEVKTEKVNSPFFDGSPEENEQGSVRINIHGQSYAQNGNTPPRPKFNVPFRDPAFTVESEKGDARIKNQKDERKVFGVFRKPSSIPNVLSKPNDARNKNVQSASINGNLHTKNQKAPVTEGATSDTVVRGQKTNFVEKSNIHSVENDHQQIQSSLPYQGLSKPADEVTSVQENSRNLYSGGRSPYFDTPSRKPASSNRDRNTPSINSHVYFDDSSQEIPDHFSNNHTDIDFRFKEKTVPYGRSYNYETIGKYFNNNRTQAKDSLRAAEIPLRVGVEYDNTDDNDHNPINSLTKPKNVDENFSEQYGFDPHKYSLKLHSISSTANDDLRSVQKLRNETQKFGEQGSKPAFEQESKLDDTALRNPSKFLQFDDDFFKPAISTHFTAPGVPNKTKPGDVKPAGKSETTKIKPSGPFDSFQPMTTKVKAVDKTPEVSNFSAQDLNDGIDFQPLFPELGQNKPQDKNQRLQNYGETPVLPSAASKFDRARSPTSKDYNTLNLIPIVSTDTSKNRQLPDKSIKSPPSPGVSNYSPNDRRTNIGSVLTGTISKVPEPITTPQVITVNYDLQNDITLDKKAETVHRPNRTDNYVIQRKPSLIPESSGKPRKPKITLSSGMLAGILIAALVFLGFLTGSMVYVFHQWKLGRRRGDRPKKVVRTPGFPPEYLDDNFAGNTYIHNNIFLPTHQNMEERPTFDQENSSTTEEEVTHEQPSFSRTRRQHRIFRDISDD